MPEVDGEFQVEKILCVEDGVFFLAVLNGAVKMDTIVVRGKEVIVQGKLDLEGNLQWVQKLPDIPVGKTHFFFKDGDTVRAWIQGRDNLSLTAFKPSKEKKQVPEIKTRGLNTLFQDKPLYYIHLSRYQDGIIMVFLDVLETKTVLNGCFVEEVPAVSEIVVRTFDEAGDMLWEERIPNTSNKRLFLSWHRFTSVLEIRKLSEQIKSDRAKGILSPDHQNLSSDTNIDRRYSFAQEEKLFLFNRVVRKRTYVEKDWGYEISLSTEDSLMWKEFWAQRYRMCDLIPSNFLWLPSGQALLSGGFDGDIVIGDSLFSASYMYRDGFFALLSKVGKVEKVIQFSNELWSDINSSDFSDLSQSAYMAYYGKGTDTLLQTNFHKSSGSVIFQVK